MRERYYLFQELDLRAVLEAQGQKMVNEIDGLEPRRLLDSDLEEFCNYFEHKYKLQAPELKEAEIEVDHEEIQVDVRGDPNRPFIIDRSRPVKGRNLPIMSLLTAIKNFSNAILPLSR